MKRKFIIPLSLPFVAIVMLLNACSKDDTTPPVVTLGGSSSLAYSLNSSAPSDPGATANDDEDGSVTVTSDWSSSNPDINKAGTYTITYSASDKEGNTGTATRVVIVKNDAAYLEGTYTDSLSNGSPLAFVVAFTQTITASTTHNNRIIFSKFGDFSNNGSIYAQVTGTSVELPTAQTAVGIGLSGCTHVFTPNGTGIAISNTSGKYRFSVTYTDERKVGGASCTATSPVPTEEIFIQQ